MARRISLAVLGFVCAAFAGETVTVDNVTDLTNHLDRLNRLNSTAAKSLGDAIILKAGVCDVGNCHAMTCCEGRRAFFN